MRSIPLSSKVVGNCMSSQKFDDVIDLLTRISSTGFTQLQAKAYIALLKLGEASGSSVASESGINRSKIYDVLSDLEHLKAVKRVSRDGKTYYIPTHPKEVLDEILKDFKANIDRSEESLLKLMQSVEVINTEIAYLTQINLKDFNINDYKILISSNTQSRGDFFNQLSRDLRPSKDVLLIDLGLSKDNNLLILISEDRGIIFDSPFDSKINNALVLNHENFSQLLSALVVGDSIPDFPTKVVEEFETGKRKILYAGKSSFMYFKNSGNVLQSAYERPIQFIISDEHISFFFEGLEDPKIPIKNINHVKRSNDGELTFTLRGISDKFLGEVRFRPLHSSLQIYNFLTFASKM